MPAPPAAVLAIVETWTQPFANGVGTTSAPIPMGTTLSFVLDWLQWTHVVEAIWLAGVAVLLVAWAAQWRRLTRIVREGADMADSREEQLLRGLERATGVRQSIRFVATDASLEPGVHGIRRPTLVWPRRLGERLSDAQIEAILAHELSHVRRRDNLTAMLHMLVRAVFWFHPPVLWIGARLLDEREKACDEEVVHLGSDPETYAEGVLKTCEFCLESPLPCVAGVTGSDLGARIRAIMRADLGRTLAAWQKAALGLALAFAIAGPVAIGALEKTAAPASSMAQTPAAVPDVGDVFEVASIKANTSGDRRRSNRVEPGGRYVATNVPVRLLISFAHEVQDFQIIGGPGWMNTDRFDVAGKGSQPEPSRGAVQSMVRSLLGDRFALRTHNETRDMPVYELTVARADGRLGPRLKTSLADCSTPSPRPPEPPSPGKAPACGFTIGPGRVLGDGITMAQLSREIGAMLGRIVLDSTGLSGGFGVDAEWTTEFGPDAAPTVAADAGVSVFTALQEQLGLKLAPSRSQVEVLVIDSVQRPTPD